MRHLSNEYLFIPHYYSLSPAKGFGAVHPFQNFGPRDQKSREPCAEVTVLWTPLLYFTFVLLSEENLGSNKKRRIRSCENRNRNKAITCMRLESNLLNQIDMVEPRDYPRPPSLWCCATNVLTVLRETLTQYITFNRGGRGESVLLYSVVLQPCCPASTSL
jgi:hypothetical protein